MAAAEQARQQAKAAWIRDVEPLANAVTAKRLRAIAHPNVSIDSIPALPERFAAPEAWKQFDATLDALIAAGDESARVAERERDLGRMLEYVRQRTAVDGGVAETRITAEWRRSYRAKAEKVRGLLVELERRDNIASYVPPTGGTRAWRVVR